MNATTSKATTEASTTSASRRRRSAALAAALAVAAGGAVVAAGPATAASEDAPSFKAYDEKDSPNPLDVVGGLGFYPGADLGWIVGSTDERVTIPDVEDLGYTVSAGDTYTAADGDTYAPSFQLVTTSEQNPYARLVWEPYMQKGNLNDSTGTYTNLQDGVWWTNKIASGPGSQSDPQPLEFFRNGGGAGWSDAVVFAIDVHQGKTSPSTHVVKDVMFNGHQVPLGTTDPTPFDEADIAAATAPLNTQLSAARSTSAKLTAQVADLNDEVAALRAYRASHAHSNAAYDAKADALLASRAKSPFSVSGTMKVGKKLTASGTKVSGVHYSYRWYVGGKAVSKATGSTFKLPESAAGHTVLVKVTRTYKDSSNHTTSVTTTERALSKATVSR